MYSKSRSTEGSAGLGDICLLKTILWGLHQSLFAVEKDVQILGLVQMPIP